MTRTSGSTLVILLSGALAKVAMMLKNKEVREKILKVKEPAEIMEILREH